MLLALPLAAEGKMENTYYEYLGIEKIIVNGLEQYSVVIEGNAEKDRGHECRMEVIQPSNSRFRVQHDTRDGIMRIWVKDTHLLFSSSRGVHSILLKVSSQMDIEVSSRSSPIRASGLRGNILLHTDSGKIHADSISGTISLSADSGALRGESLTGSIMMHSDSGRIFLRESRGECTIRSDSGALELRRVTGSLNLTTDSGKIQGEGVLLSGNSSAVTDSGAVDLQLMNPARELRISANTESGALSIFSTLYENRIETGKGEIHLELRSDSGRLTVQ